MPGRSKIPFSIADRSTLQGVFLGLVIVALLTVIVLYRNVLGLTTWRDLIHAFFPCQTPITYTIGDVDPRFAISSDQFSQAISSAENIWESSIGKNLFERKENAELTVNLIYDYRQAGTEKLQELGLNIQTNNESYESLKAEYDSVYQTYQTQKTELDTMLSTHEARSNAYDAKAESANKQGGATPRQYRELEEERKALNAEADAINQKVQEINTTADTLNTLADALNTLADELNLTADRYKTIGNTLGDEFVEGTFGASNHGDEINIYQFEDQEKLVRVLAHELGHALGLDHVDDSNAIMYRLNQGENGSLTNADITALKHLCRMK